MKSDDKISAWNLIARNWIQTDGIRRGRRGTRICGCSNKSRLECEFQRCGFLWELRVSNTCTTSKCSFPIILESLTLLLELIIYYFILFFIVFGITRNSFGFLQFLVHPHWGRTKETSSLINFFSSLSPQMRISRCGENLCGTVHI